MFIFSNLATSLDGKIATQKRSFFPLGTEEDLNEMIRLRKKADAILIGASTLRSFKKPNLVPQSSQQPVNLVMSSTLSGISPQWEFFKSKKIKRILFVSHLAPAARIRAFQKSCEIVILKKPSKKHPVAFQIIQDLEEKGIQRLLIEGGGGVMWDFVSQGLIDEFHVTLTPRILGGSGAPTLVDGQGFTPLQSLQLKLRQCRVVGEEIFLVYSRKSV